MPTSARNEISQGEGCVCVKKGSKRILFGFSLIILQTISVVGNTLAGTTRNVHISFDSLSAFLYDFIFFLSYFFVGIWGIALLILGLIARYKKSPTSQAKYTSPDSSPKEEIVALPKTPPIKSQRHSHIFSKRLLIVISVLLVIFLSTFGIYSLFKHQRSSGFPDKSTENLYNWLTEHGTLVDGTCLQYSETDSYGNEIILCYNTNYVKDLRWQIRYIKTDSSQRTITTTLFLFSGSKKYLSEISVHGFGIFSNYFRSMEYYHIPSTFTKNTPIEQKSFTGSQVTNDIFISGQGPTTVVDNTPGLQDQLNNMDKICKDNAQQNLCVILDWLKDSLCPTVKMSMSDFGYNKY